MLRALEHAGLLADQWQICSHTLCSHRFMRSVHLAAVVELAGDSSFEVTLRYAHILAETVAELDETSTTTNATSPTTTRPAPSRRRARS